MNNIKQIVIEAITEAIAHEVKLVECAWGVSWNRRIGKWVFDDPHEKTSCALGTVLLKYQPDQEGNLHTDEHVAAAKFFDVHEDYILGFVCGFDGVTGMKTEIGDSVMDWNQAHLGWADGMEVRNQFRDKISNYEPDADSYCDDGCDE